VDPMARLWSLRPPATASRRPRRLSTSTGPETRRELEGCKAAHSRGPLTFSSTSSADRLSKPLPAPHWPHEYLVGSRADENREQPLAPLKIDCLQTHEYLVRLAQSRAGKTNGLDTKHLTH